MLLEFVEIQNYGSIQKPLRFTLNNRDLTLICGDNGAGKSTIFDAIDWCLFGAVPKGDAADSVVNEQAGADCLVSVTLDAGKQYRITRARKHRKYKNAVQIMEDGEDISSPDIAVNNDLIVNIIGMDRDVFHAGVYYSQFNRLNFADATEAERMQLISKILELDEIDAWAAAFSVKQQENRGEIQILETEKANIEGKLAGMKGLDLQRLSGNWEEQHIMALSLRQDALTNLETELAEVKEHANYPVLIATRDDCFAKLQNSHYENPELEGALKEAEDNLAAWNRQLNSFLTSIDSLDRKIRDWEKRGVGICRQCGQEITQEYLKSQIAGEVEELEGLKVSRGQAETAVDGWQREVANRRAALTRDRTAHDNALQAVRKRLADAEVQIRIVEQDRLRRQELQYRIEAVVQEIQNLENEINPYIKEIAENDRKVEACESQLKILLSKLADADTRYRDIQFWLDACKSTGLKNYIVDARLAQLNEYVNYWVGVLTDGGTTVEIDTEKAVRGGKKTTNKLDLRIYSHDKTGAKIQRNYKSWSGGEKQRVSLGVDFGLSQLVASRASRRCNIMILDEIVRHLDHEGKQAIMQLLATLSEDKSSIFVIDHDAQIQGLFDNVVAVTKTTAGTQYGGSYEQDEDKAAA